MRIRISHSLWDILLCRIESGHGIRSNVLSGLASGNFFIRPLSRDEVLHAVSAVACGERQLDVRPRVDKMTETYLLQHCNMSAVGISLLKHPPVTSLLSTMHCPLRISEIVILLCCGIFTLRSPFTAARNGQSMMDLLNTIESLVEKVSLLTEECEKKDRINEKKEECIQELREGLEGKEEFIQELREGLKGKEECIQELREGLEGKEMKIQELEDIIVSQGECIQELREGMEGKEMKNQELENIILLQEDEIQEKNKEIQDLREQMEDLKATVEHLEGLLRKCAEGYIRCSTELKEKQKKSEELYQEKKKLELEMKRMKKQMTLFTRNADYIRNELKMKNLEIMKNFDEVDDLEVMEEFLSEFGMRKRRRAKKRAIGDLESPQAQRVRLLEYEAAMSVNSDDLEGVLGVYLLRNSLEKERLSKEYFEKEIDKGVQKKMKELQDILSFTKEDSWDLQLRCDLTGYFFFPPPLPLFPLPPPHTPPPLPPPSLPPLIQS
jgi:hypothetical protein